MLNETYQWDLGAKLFYETAPYNYIIVDNFFDEQRARDVRAELLKSWNWRYKNRTAQELYARRPQVSCLDDITKDLKTKLAFLLNDLELVNYWAVIHNQNVGLHSHADNGAIAVNIWLTEEKYSLDGQQIGLKLFDVKRTSKMKVPAFGTMPACEDFLRAHTKGNYVEIPYRFNRAVIFDAATFHCSGTPFFQCSSPSSSKINFTLVYDAKEAFEYRLSF